MQKFLLSLVVAAIAWGAFAFGAVYPWAYTPLAAVCAGIGLMGLRLGSRVRPPISGFAIALLIVVAAVALQLVPLPASVLARVSPGTHSFLKQYDFGYAAHPASVSDSRLIDVEAADVPSRPASIAPEKTMVGLALLSALALLLLGATRLFSIAGARAVATAVMLLGLVLTVEAMVQLALNPDAKEFTLIYGFWRPNGVSMPFGPFVNPNHYAGWMLMALPLSLGLTYGTFERARLAASPGLRNAVASALAGEGGWIALSAFACLAMAASLLMTKSRSALACFALLMILAGGMIIARQPRRSGRAIVGAMLALLFVGAFAWAGVDTVVDKWINSDPVLSSKISRLSAWKDTLRIIRDDPWTGTGLDTYARAMLLYEHPQQAGHFREAHNDYLQIAAEGGVLLVVPALCALWLFIAGVRRRFREAPKHGSTYWLRVGAVVGMMAIALQSFVEFSLQMPGNATLFVVLAAIALHQSPRLMSRPAPLRDVSH